MQTYSTHSKNYIFFVLMLVIMAGCKKPERDDLSGVKEFSGTVKYIDTIRGTAESLILGSQIVKISLPGTDPINNFLYSVNSKENGTFTFTNLEPKGYLISSGKKINNLEFSATLEINPGANNSVDLVLLPDTTKANIIVLTVRDKLTKGRLNKANVCFFSSGLLAGANVCEGSFFTNTTDQYGKVFTTSLLPGKYFINAQLVSGSVNIKVKDSIDVLRTTGIYSKTIYLE